MAKYCRRYGEILDPYNGIVDRYNGIVAETDY